MAAITHIRSLEYVAKMMGENLELLEAIVCNDDNLTYGSIISNRPVVTACREAGW